MKILLYFHIPGPNTVQCTFRIILEALDAMADIGKGTLIPNKKGGNEKMSHAAFGP